MDVQRLSRTQKATFSVGHVLNDLCASMWFSYLLLFLHNVLQFSNVFAGYLMLLGQVVDALCTPFVGYESDRTPGCGNYGKRKTWHLIGSACVACSFPFVFMQCITCADSDDWAKFVYYAPFVVIFQFGWASTQISHLSLIPDLTACQSSRVELNSSRYAMTVVSSIAVYAIAAGIFGPSRDSSALGPQDLDSFRTLALIVVGMGGLFSLVFHVGTKENARQTFPSAVIAAGINKDASDSTEVSVVTPQFKFMEWRDWLKQMQFYQIAGIYMCTRLIVNVSQIYIPMYLVHSLQLDKVFIAIVPLAVFVSGFMMSIAMKFTNRVLGRKGSYFLGLCLVFVSCVCFWCLQYLSAHLETILVFGPAILLGAGGSTILVTSLSMTADLIGEHTYSGAFVYGAMSFTDKLSNGIAVVLIQHFHPCKTDGPCCAACVWYYRDAMVFIPGGIAILTCFILLSLLPQNIGRLTHSQDEEDERRPLLGNTVST
ncbi:hypothetical protein CAPTEDRAFT_96409 [Capitella teleta]|uniref:Major facilitator superfamily (MFS) profile domain-containing protein n=1 Tax=Capitella teleta TaxID=283909 RepID=R7UXX9_CAPTE|nr:hypothetical protein CAPTEDRAFT_96409 [Capitella teleta]|eukprot:ELU08281.1 hypothetical protein CAPTEDRAFT_96409 [Capitella teleta]